MDLLATCSRQDWPDRVWWPPALLASLGQTSRLRARLDCNASLAPSSYIKIRAALQLNGPSR